MLRGKGYFVSSAGKQKLEYHRAIFVGGYCYDKRGKKISQIAFEAGAASVKTS
jgi:hypothetical protein